MDPFSNTEKLMQTFRMPRELVVFLKQEAESRGLDLTAYVVKALDALRTFWALPTPAARLLDEDRKALGLDRLDYLHHLIYERSVAIREKGPGFDVPRSRR